MRGLAPHPKSEVGSPGPYTLNLPAACLLQVWFQNRRSKERRMKQLSALGARRHAFFRSPRRMRPLVDRLEPGELIPNGPFSFYGGGCAAQGQGAGRPGVGFVGSGWQRGGASGFRREVERGEGVGEGWGVNQEEVVRQDRIPDPE